MDLTGFDTSEIEDLMTQFHVPSEGLTDDDEVPELPEEPICRYGDLWQLGEHRLLCGDATKREDVERLMGGEKADMVFTDPPYGMNLQADFSKMHKGGKTYNNIIGDDKPFNPTHLLNLAKEVFLWGADYYCQLLPAGGSWTVWNKLDSSKYEGLETVNTNTIGNGFELCWSKVPHKRIIRNCLWHGSIYNEGKDEERKKGTSVLIRWHPTQKPIKLFAEMISEYSKDDDLVLDLYGGSGSTLIACQKVSRRCFMMEIEPHYCDVIIKRWENFTGNQAVLLEKGNG
jgi:DNA modification methylase